MRGDEIRSQFLGFFQERGHRVVPSSSLIAPVPGILLTNAGMNQFVPYFLGQQDPPYKRAVSSQKCMRTGDIEYVGHDARHLTFFEMLGNFSFGDYFKKDAIRSAHQLVTERYGIDHDRLWVTVFESDDEAAQLWIDEVGLAPERIDTVFETDLLRPLIETGERVTGRRYGEDDRADVSLRILAEHGRACTFLIGDGILPSNEGRGYVLRRMLRRLVTHARKLGVERPVMGDLVDTTVEVMGQAYPELAANKAFIHQVGASEEERFAGTYRQGMTLFETEAVKAKQSGARTLPGSVAFRLHDTYGFPGELTLEAAAEEGLAVDTEEFGRLMDEQRRRAREAAKKGGPGEEVLAEVAQAAGPTESLGYEKLESEARILGLLRDGTRAEAARKGERVRFVLDRTPFYAEGGGQIGDAGKVTAPAGVIEVTDTRPGPGGTIVHEGTVSKGEVRQDEEVLARVDAPRREATARSHTATHVLHHTLRTFLGEHARQAGSLVAPGRLRFDFTHFEAVPRSALEEVESLANRRLADDQPTRAYETTLDFARSQGAMAVFGE